LVSLNSKKGQGEKVKEILLVTKGDRAYDEAFSYVFDLSKILDARIHILMVYDKPLLETVETNMAATAFAEAGESKTVKEILQDRQHGIREDAINKLVAAIKKYTGNSVEINCDVAEGRLVPNIMGFLKKNKSIEMVFLSPSVNGNGFIGAKEIFKKISIPVVTMSRLKEGEV
jgi:hypothetical protein